LHAELLGQVDQKQETKMDGCTCWTYTIQRMGPQAYLQFNIICKRITNERETHQSQILEDTFLAYALETFGVTGGRRRRPNKQKAAEEDDDEECYNELEEV